MATGASQIFVERVREAAAILGIGTPAPTVKSYALISLGTTQSTDLLAGDHIQFNAITEQSANNDISVSTGAGQANGLVTLPAGKVFELSCEVGVLFGSAVSSFRLQFRNNTGAVLLGEFVQIEPFTLAGDVHASSVCWAFAPAGALEIEARLVFVSGTITQIQRSAIRATLLKVREL